MTPAQRKLYHGTLWPAACIRQGWTVKDEARRKAVTVEATGQESTSGLTQPQVTLLFNKLKWLANPTDYDLAYSDANPDEALAADQRGRVVWRIEHTAATAGLNEGYLCQAAAGKVQAHSKKNWRDLPMTELVKFAMTIRQRAQARNRAAKGMQESCNSDADTLETVFSSESAPQEGFSEDPF